MTRPLGTRFVCGFMFDSPMCNVALILKNRGPANMAGRFNGIGGKIEGFETIRAAMAREFCEETGLKTEPIEWSNFHTERYVESGAVVYFMAATSMLFHTLRTATDEQVIARGAEEHDTRDMYNLRYLIPMAQTWLVRPGDRYFES